MSPPLSPIEHAILVELPPRQAMHPLLEHRSPAMLSVGGKPLVQYWCEQLHTAGIKRLHLLVSHFPEQVRQFVGDGARWGLDISLSTIPEHMPTKLLLKQIQPYINDNLLLSNFQILPGQRLPMEEHLINTISISDEDSIGSLFISSLVSKQELGELIKEQAIPISTLADDDLIHISTPKELWQANMDVLSGRIEDLVPTGYETDPGIYLDVGVQIKPGVKFSANCRIGQQTLLQNQSEIGPNTVIGQHCIIDEFSQIKDSVIMENAYIGTYSQLDRVIADGKLIYQVDTELATWIDDPAIVGSTQIKNQSVGVINRFFALLILLICFPGFILFGLRGLLKNRSIFGKDTFYIPVGQDLMGNAVKQEIQVNSFHTEHQFWRKIPWLTRVLTGQFNLVGVTAESNETPDIPKWAREISILRPGVINLYDLVKVEEVDADRHITDSYYTTTRSFIHDALLTGKWVLRLLKI